jgi:hypothetical protein
MRLHIEYKFAATSFLAIGRKRVRQFMRDPGYEAFRERLRTLAEEDGATAGRRPA